MWDYKPASTWLSSFVLRTMCCARKYIQIHPKVVFDLFAFLGARQHATVQYLGRYRVHHREMIVIINFIWQAV